MNKVTIKDSPSLEFLSNYLSLHKSDLISDLITKFEDAEMIENGSDDWGKSVSDILQDWEVSPTGVSIIFLSSPDPSVVHHLSNLIFISLDNDCPECGAETEDVPMWEFGRKWTDKRCSHCGHEQSNEPYVYETYED
jgi:Zn ribbon nucleic-acid-binding protein